ncbi:MAG: hypothetical protein RIF32_03840 [Leptospirales bacterium]|jgi:hypothetical protein
MDQNINCPGTATRGPLFSGVRKDFKRRLAIFAGVSLFLLTLGAPALSAARRVYESKQPLEKTVVAMLDQMSAAKMKFTVRKVYDRKADGKEGFVMYLAPRNTLCEITFRADPTQPKRSVILVYTQDIRDSETLHRFFTQRMKLAEVGVTDDFDDSNPWPVRVR